MKSFLEYYKLVLSKVSFDAALLQKEYKKALKYLSNHEQQEFERWLHEQNLHHQLKFQNVKQNSYNPLRKEYWKHDGLWRQKKWMIKMSLLIYQLSRFIYHALPICFKFDLYVDRKKSPWIQLKKKT